MVTIWQKVWPDPLYSESQMKMVEFEDETNTIECVIENYTVIAGFAMEAIMASKLQLLMRWCVDEFHQFTTIVRA